VSIEKVRFGASLGAPFTSDLALADLTDPDGPGPAVAPATATLQQISDLYVAYFNRAPDVQGLMYWFAEISSGRWQIDQVASSFTDQAEYRKAYPAGQSAADFITAIYGNLFDRAPDPDGFKYWSGELARGMPRDSFILTVIRGAYAPTGSADDKALLNHKHAVSLYYSEQLALHPGEAFDNAIDLVLNKVDARPGSVTSAMKVIDHLMQSPVGLVGLSQDTAAWTSLWA